jgi:hypothetical protein
MRVVDALRQHLVGERIPRKCRELGVFERCTRQTVWPFPAAEDATCVTFQEPASMIRDFDLSLRPLFLAGATLLGAAGLAGCVAEAAPLDKLEGDAVAEDFDLAADSLTRPTEMGEITSGATVNGTFGRNARYLAWTFTAEASDTIEITAEGVSPRSLDTVVSVYRTTPRLRPTGRALASNDDCDPTTLGSCVSLTAPESATFVIVVRRYDRGTSGTFALSLDVVSSVRRCGSRGLGPCHEDEYCAFAPEANCGRADHPGVCTRRPDACIALYNPVCGCDGTTYSNACAAANAGVSVETEGECAGSCTSEITAIQEAASQVWFLSESDRPITVQMFEGEGVTAPTLETVLAYAMAPAGARATVRETDRFARGFEPAPGSPDGAPAALSTALGVLSDLLYVAIVSPDEPAVVRVILVGRTRCGELVWLESISIET